MKRKKVLVFTATYNEKNNISEYCRKVFDALPDCDLLVVDDNSTDGTRLILDELKREYPRLSVINRPGKMGLGSAHKIAMMYSKNNGYEILVTMDADLSHDPDDIPRLVKEIEHADLVIGSRYMKGGSCDYSGYRKYISVIANWGARKLLGIPLQEFTTSLRAFRVSIFEKLNFSNIRSQGYAFFLESIFMISRHKFILKEIPIHFRDRKSGSSKIPKFEIFYGISNLFRLYLSKVFNRNYETTSLNINSLCYFCGSPYLIEQFSERHEKNGKEKIYNSIGTEDRLNIKVVNCIFCGLSFVPRMVNNEKIKEMYSIVDNSKYHMYQQAHQKTFLEVYKKVAPFISKSDSLLVVVSNNGFFLEIAEKSNLQVTSLELSKSAAKPDLKPNVKNGTLADNLEKLRKDFDVIVLWNIIERLTDPLLVLTQLHSVLKKDGILCLSVTEFDHGLYKLISNHLSRLMYLYYFYFTRLVLEQFLRKAGFEIVNSQNYCHYVSLQNFIEKMELLLPWRIGEMFAFLKPLVSKKILIPLRFGSKKLYICRKR